MKSRLACGVAQPNVNVIDITMTAVSADRRNADGIFHVPDKRPLLESLASRSLCAMVMKLAQSNIDAEDRSVDINAVVGKLRL